MSNSQTFNVSTAGALLHEAACECMSPDQMDRYDALFADAGDLTLRFLRCILKRVNRGNASE